MLSLQFPYKLENIGSGVQVCVTEEHTFGTDSFLLAYFAAPRRKDIACDLCSGCGIVPLLWMRGEGGPKTAHAVDIRPQAVEQIAISARISGLEGRLVPLQHDLRLPCAALRPGSFDLVSANPPYNAPATGLLSRSEAGRTARHETECSIGDLCAAAARLLRFGGRLCLCHIPERLPDVLEAMRRHRLEPKRLRFVQKRTDTAPWLFLVEGRLGGKPFLRVEPPLALYRRRGGATAEMAQIYSAYGKV